MPGRPRSEAAREAVLKAVDDLLVDVGYAEMTMKGIAARAGVGRQTVYRWWSTKAEILLEACVEDAAEELTTSARTEAPADLFGYLSAVSTFLVDSPAGLAYRALLGEAQADRAVANLLAKADPLGTSTQAVLDRLEAPGMPAAPLARAQLIGPVILQVLTTGKPLTAAALRTHVRTLLRGWA